MPLPAPQTTVDDSPLLRLRQLEYDLDWLTGHIAGLPGMDLQTAHDVVAAASDLGQWVGDEIGKLSQQSREVMP
jgi:hypothetical protein